MPTSIDRWKPQLQSAISGNTWIILSARADLWKISETHGTAGTIKDPLTQNCLVIAKQLRSESIAPLVQNRLRRPSKGAVALHKLAKASATGLMLSLKFLVLSCPCPAVPRCCTHRKGPENKSLLPAVSAMCLLESCGACRESARAC